MKKESQQSEMDISTCVQRNSEGCGANSIKTLDPISHQTGLRMLKSQESLQVKPLNVSCAKTYYANPAVVDLVKQTFADNASQMNC